MALHRINLNLPADLHSRFVATARREDRTLTVVLVRALEAYIVGSKEAADRGQGNRAVGDLVVPGSFSTSSNRA